MNADFTRDTFDPQKRFLRVLLQQGRVQLDADFNEQVSILLHYMQTLATDIIGPHGGPAAEAGFGITLDEDAHDLKISKGRYYVDGILCENDSNDVTYRTQPNYPLRKEELDLPELPYLVYLDVWERHITAIEDDSIREVALRGPDTATRSSVVWQVRVLPLEASDLQQEVLPDCDDLLRTKLGGRRRPGQGKLLARLHPGDITDDHCILPPESRYRGTENQLYRVEIHKPRAAPQENDESAAADQQERTNADGGSATGRIATFKWSRDNGSVAFPILNLSGNTATVEQLGQDDRRTLERDDWVEVIDDHLAKQGRSGPLFQVAGINPLDQTITLRIPPDVGHSPSYDEHDSEKHPQLRRWDSPGAVNVTDPDGDGWIPLEDGIEVRFVGDGFKTGDYWLIPARTATGEIQWPHKVTSSPNGQLQPKALAPYGIIHHYAPLALVSTGDTATSVKDCWCTFDPLCGDG